MRKRIVLKIRKMLKVLGPGIITGAADDDPSGILTYLQAGAVLGFQSLWTVIMTLPMMYAVQEMCGRLGYVTNKGLMRLIKDHYPKYVLYPVAVVSILVITINIGADLLAIGVVMEKMLDISRLFWLVISAMLILACTIFLSYRKFAGILKWLAFTLFFYVITVFFIRMDWVSALKSTVLPNFVFSRDGILLVTAIFGTTISPYLFFWQASEEAEERQAHMRENNLKKFVVTKHELKMLKDDTMMGMLFSNFITWFIIAGAGFLSFHGLTYINNFDDASRVLKPLLGDWAYLCFSLGIIGTGFLAIPVLAGAIGYIMAEVFNWEEGMNKKFMEAKGFYFAIILATIVGAILTVSGLDPVQLLIYTGVFYTLVTPILIYFILRLSNNPKVVKTKVSSPLVNVLGIATIITTTFLSIIYVISSFI